MDEITNSVSIITSYKESNYNKFNPRANYRKNNLIKVIEYIDSSIDDCNIQIIIVEQDSKPTVDWINKLKVSNNIEIDYLFIKNDKIFNKGLGYNVGAKNAKYDTLIFHDGDIIPRKDSYSFISKLDEGYDMVKPYTIIKKVNEYYSMSNFSRIDAMSVPTIDRRDYGHKDVVSGGIFFIKKDTYMKLKGFEEKCYGYGYEDSIFDLKIKRFNQNVYYCDGYECLHLYHLSYDSLFLKKMGDKYYNREDKNKDLYLSIRDLPNDEFFKYIDDIEKFGEINDEE